MSADEEQKLLTMTFFLFGVKRQRMNRWENVESEEEEKKKEVKNNNTGRNPVSYTKELFL